MVYTADTRSLLALGALWKIDTCAGHLLLGGGRDTLHSCCTLALCLVSSRLDMRLFPFTLRFMMIH